MGSLAVRLILLVEEMWSVQNRTTTQQLGGAERSRSRRVGGSSPQTHAFQKAPVSPQLCGLSVFCSFGLDCMRKQLPHLDLPVTAGVGWCGQNDFPSPLSGAMAGCPAATSVALRAPFHCDVAPRSVFVLEDR